MSKEQEVEDCATEMAAMLHSDSHIPMKESFPILRQGLKADLKATGRLPDLYERECLVFGGPLTFEDIDEEHPETHGEGNPRVTAAFPNTDKALGSFF